MIKKIKKWFNHHCFWFHDYKIAASELRAVAYKCTKCDHIRIQRF